MKYSKIILFCAVGAGLTFAGCSGEDGRDGATGRDGEPCSVSATDTGATISCPDGTTVDLADGMDGMNGVDGTNCTVTDNGDGTITIDCGDSQVTYSAVPEEPTAFTLQILHVADGEARASAVDDAPRFSAVLEALRSEFPNTVTLSSGDNFIAGPWAGVSGDSSLSATVGIPDIYRPDIVMMNAMGFQASCIGNHEFDSGPEGFATAIIPESSQVSTFPGANFPYLSANVDVRTDADLGDLVTTDGQEASDIPGRIARSVVITVAGERVGIVGATTPTLANIANIGNEIVVRPDDPDDRMALAAEIQSAVDNLTATGIDKVILLAHMQAIQVELDLAPLLRDVDVVIAGGSNTVLGDANDRLRAGDTAFDSYPIMLTSAAAEPIMVVNTDGSWRYVGRLVVPFGASGLILSDRLNDEINGAYAADEQGVADVNGLPNPTVQAIADAIGAVLQAQESNIFGRTTEYLNGIRASVRSEETNLGNLTADANLWQARQVETQVDFSIKNGGGIRDEIGFREFPPGSTDPSDERRFPPAAIPAAGKESGDISEGDIARTLAFNNGLVTFNATATELKAILESGVENWDGTSNDGRMPQVGGLKFSFDPMQDPGGRVQTVAIVDDAGSVTDIVVQNGNVVGDPGRIFRGVTLDFLFNINGSEGRNGYDFPRNPDAAAVELLNANIPTGTATFELPGSEQDALAEYLAANFPASDPFMMADTPIEMDERIQNLNFRTDGVLGINPTLTIDGDLSDWTNPTVTLTNPGFGGSGLFGPDNRLEELLVFGDANFLYLGYRYRSSGNSAIIHMDTVAGGQTSAAMFDAWPRAVDFAAGIDHFVAQFENQGVQFRSPTSATSAPFNGDPNFVSATTGSAPAFVTEMAIPWTAIGLGGTAGARTLTLYGGIYGGENFGAGDVIPNEDSTPSAAGNTIDTNDSFRVDFMNGLQVSVP